MRGVYSSIHLQGRRYVRRRKHHPNMTIGNICLPFKFPNESILLFLFAFRWQVGIHISFGIAVDGNRRPPHASRYVRFTVFEMMGDSTAVLYGLCNGKKTSAHEHFSRSHLPLPICVHLSLKGFMQMFHCPNGVHVPGESDNEKIVRTKLRSIAFYTLFSL